MGIRVLVNKERELLAGGASADVVGDGQSAISGQDEAGTGGRRAGSVPQLLHATVAAELAGQDDDSDSRRGGASPELPPRHDQDARNHL